MAKYLYALLTAENECTHEIVRGTRVQVEGAFKIQLKMDSDKTVLKNTAKKLCAAYIRLLLSNKSTYYIIQYSILSFFILHQIITISIMQAGSRVQLYLKV